MLVVIFGAGASYDSYGRYPAPEDGRFEVGRPPLADHLFEPDFEGTVFQSYRQARGLAARLRPGVRQGTVEEALRQLSDEAESDPRRDVELLALRFFLRDAIFRCVENWERQMNGVSNYAALLTQLRNWQSRTNEPVALVTFNYDQLLDDACHDILGLDLGTVEGYMSSGGFKLYKVHGSTNWVQPLSNKVKTFGGPNPIIELGRLVDPLPDVFAISPVGPVSVMVPDLGERACIPAIAVPLAGKSDFACPTSHIVQLRSDLAESRLALVIGWAGADEDFAKVWAESRVGRRTHIAVANGSRENGQSAAYALDAFLAINMRNLDCGFTQLVEGDQLLPILDHAGEQKR
jgi:hypothetical protein